jgi:hypothetical protein
MTKTEAIQMIDEHKNNLAHPMELLRWTWLRVIILRIPENEWERYLDEAVVVLSK